MIHRSQLPPLTIPAVALTPFVLEKPGRLRAKVALVDVTSGRSITHG